MVLVGIGANLPDKQGRSALETCRWAAGALDALPGWRVRALSRWYRTAPVPASDQPDYVNGVAHLTGSGSARSLLAALHGIEAEAGRVRYAVNAARVLDLDLLAFDDAISSAPELMLPHPRLTARAFVLVPLQDIAPAWLHPMRGCTAAQMLQTIDSTQVQPLLSEGISIR